MNLKPLVWVIIFAIWGTLIIGVGNAVAYQDWASNAGAPLSANGVVYTYDTDGNRSTRSDGVTTSYIYDESNRLTRVERPTGTVIARYGYDPMGERLWKEDGAGQRTYFEYNDDGIQAELDSTGAVVKSYIFAPGSAWGTNPLAMKQGTYNYYHNDHQGRPVKLTNNVGAVTWSGQYSAYGIGSITAQGAVNNIRAPGQYADSETGLYNNFQRNYDPALGVYAEEDPYGVDVTGPNRFLYVNGEPVLGVDPTGEMAPWVLLGQLIRRGLIWAVPRIGPALWGRKKVAEKAADFAGDEVMNDFPMKRCYAALRDPCQTVSIPPECWEFVEAHAPVPTLKRGKRLPGVGVDSPNGVPGRARDVLDHVKKTGNPPNGFKGGREFQNDGRQGSKLLPKFDSNGRPISYREYDVNPYEKGVNRGSERIVRGTDGNAYYTDDHYATFTPID